VATSVTAMMVSCLWRVVGSACAEKEETGPYSGNKCDGHDGFIAGHGSHLVEVLPAPALGASGLLFTSGGYSTYRMSGIRMRDSTPATPNARDTREKRARKRKEVIFFCSLPPIQSSKGTRSDSNRQ